MAKNKKKKKNTAARKPSAGNTAAKKGQAPKLPVKQAKAVEPTKKVEPAKADELTKKVEPAKAVETKPEIPNGTSAKNGFSAFFSRLSLHKKTALLILCAGVFVAAVCFAVASGYNEFMLRKIGVSYAAVLQRESVYDIGIDAEEVKQRVKDTDRNGQKSAFGYFCESEISLRNSTQYGALIFGNPESNDCDLVATILDKDGRLLYRSDGIAPGKYLSQIRLFAGLEAGEHTCRLYVVGFDRETQKAVGVQYTKLKIVVEENLDG